MYATTYLMEFRNPGFCGWPAVTRCRICNKRVWIWQPHERRSYSTPIEGSFSEGSGIIHMEASLTTTVHTKCSTDEPLIEPIKIVPVGEREIKNMIKK